MRYFSSLLGSSVITSEDIEKRPPANDISELVRTQPGVNLTGNSSSGQYGNNRQIDLRGMGPENTLILIDGKPVLSREGVRMGRSGERDTRGDSNWVPAESIERVEVIRGPAAARYGSGAAGGVVNIITKKPGDKFAGSVTAYADFPQHGEEQDTRRLSFNLSGPVAKDLSFRVYGNVAKTSADEPGLNAAASGVDLTDSTVPPAGREGVRNRDINGLLRWDLTPEQVLEFEAGFSRQGNIYAGERPISASGNDMIAELANAGAETNSTNRRTASVTHRGRWGKNSSRTLLQYEGTDRRPHLEDGAYVTDVAYPAQFVRELMPLWLGSTLTSLGRLAPDVDQAFDWLELGCGAGLSTLVAAANHPAAHFTGIDLGQREIERATALAKRAGLANVDFICQSIETAADAESSTSPPKRDFIVCNGVYSWVGEPVRKAVERIVAQQLRPSGVVYLSYMSQPGAASFSAAQRLLRLMARGHPGDSAAQARNGMNLLLSLEQAGAGYFVEHPAAARDMQQASASSDAALAHEYLNEHWQAFHAADILQSFASIGCEWAGSAMPLDNIDAVSLPAQVQPIVQQLRQQGADALLLETVRDIARNQNLRMDIFQKAPSSATTNRLDLSEHRQVLLRQKVMLAPPARLSQLTSGQHLVLSTRIGPVDIPLAQVQPLLEAVQDVPKSYAELASLPTYAGNPGFINQLLQALAWAGWIRFIRSSPSTDLEEIEQRCQRLQQVLKDAGLGDWRIDAHAATAMPQASA